MLKLKTAQPSGHAAPPDQLMQHGGHIKSVVLNFAQPEAPGESPAGPEATAADSQTAFVYLKTAIPVPNVSGMSDREVETAAAVRLGEMLVNGEDLEFSVEVE